MLVCGSCVGIADPRLRLPQLHAPRALAPGEEEEDAAIADSSDVCCSLCQAPTHSAPHDHSLPSPCMGTLQASSECLATTPSTGDAHSSVSSSASSTSSTSSSLPGSAAEVRSKFQTPKPF